MDLHGFFRHFLKESGNFPLSACILQLNIDPGLFEKVNFLFRDYSFVIPISQKEELATEPFFWNMWSENFDVRDKALLFGPSFKTVSVLE